MDITILTAVLAAIVISAYIYFKKWTLTYWQRRGVSTYPKNLKDIRSAVNEMYFYFKSLGQKHGGVYAFYKPLYIPVDLDLIKCIMMKNFDHFVNHGGYVNEKADPLSGHLFSMPDDRWRNLRSKLTPTFSSGKMRMMFQTMIETSTPLVDVLKKDSSLGDPVNVKDVLARFTTDIIGSAAFGIDCNSLKDPDCDFRRYGIEIGQTSWRRKVSSRVPKAILKLINFNGHSPALEGFFMKLVKQIVDYRESNHIYRKDFMHLLLQLKNRGRVVDDEKIMDDNQKGEFMKLTEMTAQCYVFFVGGFETSSSLMTFSLLELAQRQDIQDRLRKEMQTVIKKHGGITYDAIMDMNYLDQVVSESLRLHPPAFATNRVCNKTFHVPDTNVDIEPGTNILIPILPIHHDPENYPNPLKFDPERFSPENKASRHPFAYLPFGEGPRMCIGARFGLMQSKVGLTSILTNFKVTLNPRTSLPVKYDTSSLLLSVKGNVWLNFHKLEN